VRADAQGDIGFTVLVAGVLGGSRDRAGDSRFLPLADLLSYLEAILRVYNRHGRRDNLNKARIKVLSRAWVSRASASRWKRVAALRASAARLPGRKSSGCAGFFRPQPYEALEDFDASAGREPAFQAWYRYNTRPHRVSGYRAVFR